MKYSYGIDFGEEGGDKTVVICGAPTEKGGFKIIAIDEYATMPDWKWYRNPIRWWRWRQLTRKWKKNSKCFQFDSTPKGKSLWKS